MRQLWKACPALPVIGRRSAVRFQDCFNSLDKIVTAFGQRVFRCPAPPLLYWSFKCNVELLHLQRCFSTQYKIPHHPSPPANQSTSSRSRRNKAIPFTHRPNHSSPIYNVVSRPFAINLVTSSVVVALRSLLEKKLKAIMIKNRNKQTLLFLIKKNFGVLMKKSLIYFYNLYNHFSKFW